MTVNDNTRRIAELLRQRPEMRHADIAKEVGVDRRRVYQVRKYLSENGAYQNFSSERLIHYRSFRKWSLRETARRAGVNVSQISRWETNKSEPWKAQWDKLAAALGVKPSDLRKKP